MVKHPVEFLTSTADSTSVSMAIEIVLWGLTKSFLKQEVGTKSSNSACVALEQILVEHKFHGISTSLCEAVKRTSILELIEAALPYVMHCVAATLSRRNQLGQGDKLNVPSTKLLHTLHILLQDSMNTRPEGDDENRFPLRSGVISNIGLFVYLFAPLANAIKESDLTFKLAGGLKIWGPLWSHDIPDLAAMKSFITPDIETCVLEMQADDTETDSDNDDSKSHQVTAFDVTVLKCLFFYRWSEDGVLWAMTYLLKRLLPHQLERHKGRNSKTHCRRSKSLCASKSRAVADNMLSKGSSGTDTIAESSARLEGKKLHLGDVGQTRRSKRFLDKFRISEFRRKPKPSLAKPPWFSSSKDSGTLSDSEEKSAKSNKSMRMNSKRGLAHRKKFPKASSVTTSDDPPRYEVVMRRTLVRQASFDISVTTHFEKAGHKLERGRSVDLDDSTDPEKDIEKPSNSNDMHSINVAIPEEYQKPLSTRRRWASDSCVYYDHINHHKVSDSEAISSYATYDGYFRCDMLLRAIGETLDKGPGVKICDACFQIMECIAANIFLDKRSTASSNIATLMVKLGKGKTEPDKNDVLQLIDIAVKLLISQGCVRCCPSIRNRQSASERIRLKTRSLFVEIAIQFAEILSEYISSSLRNLPLKDSTELLHLLYVVCANEFNSTEIPRLDDDFDWIRGSPEGNPELKVIHDLVQTTFGDFVGACLAENNLLDKKNEDLYVRVREVIQYVQRKHAAIFNQHVLSVLLESTRKLKRWKRQKANPQSTNEKQSDQSSQKNPSTNSRRRGAVVLSHSPLPQRANEGGTKTSKLRNRFNTLRHDSFSVIRDSGRTGSVFGKLPLTYWKKNKDDDDKSIESHTSQHHDLQKQTSITEDDILMRQSSQTESVCSQFSDNDYPASDLNVLEEDKEPPKNFIVDGNDIFKGLEILRFLMNCCPPGTVPEARLVAAVLDLESPIVCRAAFFLELASFVNKCTNFDWPQWMSTDLVVSKMNTKFSRSQVRSILKLQVTAGSLFRTWGEALGQKLDQLCSLESGATIVLPNVRSDAEKIRLRDTDVREDFFCENFVNRTGTACPVPLKMMACQLLYEITSFIRDAAPQCRAMASKQVRHRSIPENIMTSGDMEAGDSSIPKSHSPHSAGRKGITFFDDPEYKLRKHSGCSLRATESKAARRSAPESSLRSDLKRTIFHSPRPRKTSSVSDYLNDNRARSSSTGSALAEVQEDSPLISVYPPNSNNDKDDARYRRESARVNSPTNFLTVPPVHIATLPSAAQNVASPEGSVSYFGDACDGESLFDVSVSNMSITSSNDGISPKSDDEPWLKVMLTIAGQQNFICKHRGFCHAYCHQRLVRSCGRLVHSLCKVLDDTQHSLEKNQDCMESIRYQFLSSAFVTRYLKASGSSLMCAPLLVLTKSVSILSEDLLQDAQSFCWEMILDDNKDIAVSAASLFLLCAVRSPQQAFSMVTSELGHSEADVRLDAILKFRALWSCRYAVWSSAKDGAAKSMKHCHSGINYTVPKEKIGDEFPPVPDAPWLPVDVTLEESISASGTVTESSALLTTDTTAHQKEKQMKSAIQRLEEQRENERRNFHLNDVPVIQLTAAEIQKSVGSVMDDEDADSLAAMRRYSHAPSIASSNYSSTKDFKFTDSSRHSTRQFGRSTKREHDDHKTQDQTSCREVAAKPPAVFPPCIAACIPTLLKSCDDTAITNSRLSVGEVALNVVESCMIEDPNLFLRHLFERLSGKDGKQLETSILLKKLPHKLGRISPHVAHAIFVNVLGIMNKAARMPGSDRNIVVCIGVLTAVTRFVEGLEFKSLKKALRKEQSEVGLLTTSASAAPKYLQIFCVGEHYLPIPVEVNDDTTFGDVILEVFGHTGEELDDVASYQLKNDTYNFVTGPHAYIGDVCFGRSTLDLTLVRMDREEADKKLNQSAILRMLKEIHKLDFTLELLVSRRKLDDKQVNASFLLVELLRLQCFPRKAIRTPFQQFKGKFGRQVSDLDMVHKTKWIELLSTIFHHLPLEVPWGDELMLFLNVWNAALVTHPLKRPILRMYGASIIDAAVQMNHQFIKAGYSLILPTLLEVYGEHSDMPSVKDFVEFLCKQLCIIHRHPFILELMATAAAILSLPDGARSRKHFNAGTFYSLLQSLEQECSVDRLQILELVKSEQPLRSFDFFYKNDSRSITILDCCRLCITVIAVTPESDRALEMLVALEHIIPCYLKHLEKVTEGDVRDTNQEIKHLTEVSICVHSLLVSLEYFARNPPSQQPPHTATAKQREDGAFGDQVRYADTAVGLADREPFGNSHDDALRTKNVNAQEEESRVRKDMADFLASRDVILRLVSTYFISVQSRLKELNLNSLLQQAPILNEKSHMRIAEIAQSALKGVFGENNKYFLKCPGLITYFTEMLPKVDWSDNDVRPTLFLLLKRLDRLFQRLNATVESSREMLDWSYLKDITTGLANLLSEHPAVSVIPHIKAIVLGNLQLLIGSATQAESDTFLATTGANVPQFYEPVILQLTMAYLNSARATVSLEDLVKDLPQERRDFVVLNLFIPLSISVSALASRKDIKEQKSERFPLRESDAIYMFDYAFNILANDAGCLNSRVSQLITFASPGTNVRVTLSHQSSLLLLKVLITCFHGNLQRHWLRIAASLQKVVFQRTNIKDTWYLVDFLLSLNTPLILYLRPFVLMQMPKLKPDGYNPGTMLDRMKAKTPTVELSDIEISDYTLEFERAVSQLKAQIVSYAPGSRQLLTDKHSREKRSIRYSVMQLGRKQSGESGARAKRPSVGTNSNSALSDSMKSVRENVSEMDARGMAQFRNMTLKRSRTQTQPHKSRPTVSKSKVKRHSVSTTQNASDVESIPMITKSVRSFLDSSTQSTHLSKDGDFTMGSDDCLDNDAISLHDDVFVMEQETRAFLSSAARRQKQIPLTKVTGPTPPVQRRSCSVDGRASPVRPSAARRSRILSTAFESVAAREEDFV